MASRGTVTVNITGDARGLGKALNDSESNLSKFGGKMGDFGKKVGKAFAIGVAAVGAGVGAVVFKTVKDLAEVERLSAQTAAAIKSTGGAANVTVADVGRLADKLEALTSIEAESVTEGANLLLTFTNIKNGVGPANQVFDEATGILTDMSVALGTDVAGSAVQVGKALNDPIAGIAALGRVGVTFTDDQKKLIKSLVDSGDTMGAQKVILAELNKEFGGSAEAMGNTLTGKIAKLKNSFGTLMEKAITPLIPVVEKVVAFLAKHLPGGFAEVEEAIGKVVPVLKDIGENVLTAISNWWDTNGPTIITIATAVGEGIRLAGEKIVAAVGWIIENWDKIEPKLKATAAIIATVMIPHFVALGVQAVINAAKTAAAWVAMHVQAIASAVIHSVQVGIMVAKWIWLGVQALASAAKVAAAWLIALGPIGVVVAAVAAAVALIIVHWDTIKDAVAKVFNWVKDNWPLLLAIITGPIGLAVLAIVKHWDAIKEAFTKVKDWIGEKIGDIVGFLTAMPGRVTRAVSGLFDGFKEAFKAAMNWIVDKWNDFKIPAVKVLGVQVSPEVNFPDLPRFHQGGLVPGRPGSEMLGILQAGERVIPRGGGGVGATVVTLNVNVTAIDPAAASEAVITAIKEYERRNGTNWRVA